MEADVTEQKLQRMEEELVAAKKFSPQKNPVCKNCSAGNVPICFCRRDFFLRKRAYSMTMIRLLSSHSCGD